MYTNKFWSFSRYYKAKSRNEPFRRLPNIWKFKTFPVQVWLLLTVRTTALKVTCSYGINVCSLLRSFHSLLADCFCHLCKKRMKLQVILYCPFKLTYLEYLNMTHPFKNGTFLHHWNYMIMESKDWQISNTTVWIENSYDVINSLPVTNLLPGFVFRSELWGPKNLHNIPRIYNLNLEY